MSKCILILLVFFTNSLIAKDLDRYTLDAVQVLLSTPAPQVDFARTKLTIDKLVDPSIDIEANIARVDAMVTAIEDMAGADASDDQKLRAIRTYIYRAGSWNDNKPFVYDLNDPLGHHIPSKLLPNYMDTKLGNCVSMPFLFIALADRMGLNVTASTAPHHVFVKYTNVAGQTINLETTSGANPSRDEWIRKNMPMTDMAIQNGVYLKTLSKHETIVVMAMVLIEHAMEEGRYGTVLNLVNVLLPHYPNFADLYLAQGSAAYKILETQFYNRFPTPRDIPQQHSGYFQHLNEVNQQAFAQAEALGWRPEEDLKK
jgi:hypothetical protein